LAVGTDVDNTTMQQLAAGSEIADLTWEAPDELTAEHAQVFQDAMRAHHGGDSERADRLWESLQAIWSQAWSANYAVLEFMQGTGLTRFAPVKPSAGWLPLSSTTPALTAFPVLMSTTSSSPVIDRCTKARYVGSVRRWWPGRGTPVTAVAASPAFATRACFTIVETGCPVPNGRTTVVTDRDWRSGGAPPWSGPPLKPGRAARLGELPMPPEGARP
jgi:hypothetical protein